MARRKGGDETWFRLLEWTQASKNAERLSLHLLRVEEYMSLDPSHPLGGRDGTKDATAHYNGMTWVVAVYFPRGQQKIQDIKKKFQQDLKGVARNQADGIVFVTNQELRLSERTEFVKVAGSIKLDLFHLERLSNLLDSPACYGLRLEFLDIEMTREEQISFFTWQQSESNKAIQMEIDRGTQIINNLMTGGDSFCYFSIASLNIEPLNLSSNTGIAALISQGKFPLYNVSARIVDVGEMTKIEEKSNAVYGNKFMDYRDTQQAETHITVREINPDRAEILGDWSLGNADKKHYNVFFSARNGSFVQLLRLAKVMGRWEEANRVEKDGQILFETISPNYPRTEFGEVDW